MKASPRGLAASVTLTALLASAPLAASAQQPAPTELELRHRWPAAVVRPAPPAEAPAKDTEEAIRALEAVRRHEAAIGEAVRETMREATVGPRGRPNLSGDVTSGIQAQRLNEALRR